MENQIYILKQIFPTKQRTMLSSTNNLMRTELMD